MLSIAATQFQLAALHREYHHNNRFLNNNRTYSSMNLIHTSLGLAAQSATNVAALQWSLFGLSNPAGKLHNVAKQMNSCSLTVPFSHLAISLPSQHVFQVNLHTVATHAHTPARTQKHNELCITTNLMLAVLAQQYKHKKAIQFLVTLTQYSRIIPTLLGVWEQPY